MYDFKSVEKEIAEFWQKNKIYEKLIKRNSKGKNYSLLDGPPYANNIPHIGHIKNTVFKDLLIRLAFMKGFNVKFQPGFDTHGLPIENMVEKKLNLQSKKDIEKFGIAKFMGECKKNAALNKNLWMEVYKKLGSLYSLKEPYLTYENYYIESGWWTFSEMHKKEMVYSGERPVMWCSHCETSLAGYEVTDSYKDVKDPGVYVLFKLKNSDENLLVYTTTPWTLPSNVAIAVAPKENYVTTEVNGKKIIIAEKRLQKLSELGFGYKILDNFKGEKLIGKKYEPLLDVQLQKELSQGKYGRAHEIVASIALLKERVASKIAMKKDVKNSGDLFEEFVTMDVGTGMVHTAPGHGKTDFIVGQKYKLAQVSPVNDQGELISITGFSGFVKKADKDIMKKLEDTGKLFSKEEIVHSYPLCWRCKTPLVFRLSDQLFLKVDEVKKIAQKENKKVLWHPEFARERFENWIDNAEDWNISRQRYWGIPIPLWECSCGEELVISGQKELEKISGKRIRDLHSIEDIKLKCKCGKQMSKRKGILDVWFDSGVAPYASLGYPFANKKLFEENFPINRINEAQDQIRGWFYSLMFCSLGVFEKSPYKEVSMTGWVVDKNGNKMSKSVGNVVTGEDAINELGADVLRYYFCYDVAPYELQKFNVDIAKKEIGKILNVLWNLKNLVSEEKIKNLNLEDKWIISRMNSVIFEFNKNIESFELHIGMRILSDFILNDLSRNYIRMTRDKNNSGVVLYCLEKILKLLATISPFITENIWQYLRQKKLVDEESVHLCSLPKEDKKKIDKNLEEKMKIVLRIIEVGLAERDKIQVGLKWPLASATVIVENKLNKELEEIILSQLNIKEIISKKGKEVFVEFDTKQTPDLEAEGYAREVARQVQDFRKKLHLNKKDKINLLFVVDVEFKKILDKQKNYIRERTNSVELGIVTTLEGVKERFKNKLDFEIKDKRGEMGIEVLTTRQ